MPDLRPAALFSKLGGKLVSGRTNVCTVQGSFAGSVTSSMFTWKLVS
jgi:hypothetical protein